MPKLILFFLSNLITFYSFAGNVYGTVTNDNRVPLPYASITVKSTTIGVTSNSEGKYSIQLAPGKYVLVCQYVGYKKEERSITVTDNNIEVNFSLPVQELILDEVIIKRGEDPAYEIIRQAIKKREFYNSQVDSFTVDVYIKGLLRSRGMPDKFMGQKINKEDLEEGGLDSTGKGILFLTESLTKVAYRDPGKYKYEVVSTKTDGTAMLDFPIFINFYNSNIALGKSNPRGFISPIADNALHYYRFKYEGSFVESGAMINRIKVTPRRKNEPLFEGYIQITENDWRIHGIDLLTTKDYQLELLDSLRVTQIHSPVNNNVWRVQNQVLYVVIKTFGFHVAGNFVNVYSNYNLNAGFSKNFFDRIVMSYDSSYNKRDSTYWTNIRPIPLERDEKQNYDFRDSVSKMDSMMMRSPRSLDSLNKAQKIKLKSLFVGGVNKNHYSTNSILRYKTEPLITNLEYNTVEGLVVKFNQSLNINTRNSKNNYTLSLNSRYGIANEHFNLFGGINIKPKRDNFRNRYIQLLGGKRVSQFNNDNPIDPLSNSISTLLYKRNYMKIYENWFGSIEYNNKFLNGVEWNINATYEERIPLQNTIDYSFTKRDRAFTPNHPYELAHISFNRHKALVTSVTLTYQPGQKYIQYPTYKQPLGSKYPTLQLQYSKGIKNILSSDVDFDKWQFSVYDNMNLKLGGEFRYHFKLGGFINDNKVEMPDFQHFNGNQTLINLKYLNSFQLAPYYRYSNTESFYTLLHAEHHFNGLFTNKIPLFNKLKWHLVAGTNAFYVNSNNYYVEAFAGIENIFKIFRVDFVTAYQKETANSFGLRIGFGGLLGGSIKAGGRQVSVSL